MTLAAKTILWIIGEFIVLGLLLFGVAGTVEWPAGWVFFISMFGLGIGVAIWLYRCSPGLLEERIESLQRAGRGWDRVFIVILLVLFVSWFAIMPLDAVRLGWSHVPLAMRALGMLLYLVSWYLFFIVFRENPYTSATVRVQRERGQKVIDSGPYARVRHPMYAAAVLFFVGAAIMLGSWAGVAVSGLLLVVLALRMRLEERLLRAELPGYAEYMEKVRYRLIPGVW
jgi:protein-S-isoprenylcysteine O-methyltransferase Ste14